MTCIVGLLGEDGSVTMGGDSAGVAGLDVVIRKDAKVFRNGPFLIGFTSSFRMGDILRYSFTPPDPTEGESVEKYMATTFIDAVREAFKEKGFLHKENQVEGGGVFLVGYLGRLFEIGGDFQVGELTIPYNAVGCGENYAKGSLHASSGFELTSRQRVRMALQAAVDFSGGVRPPFTIMTLPAPADS